LPAAAVSRERRYPPAILRRFTTESLIRVRPTAGQGGTMKTHLAIALLVSVAMAVVAFSQSLRSDGERASASDESYSCERQQRT
jgi:hypothetical protein